jgi:FkbM family methyltransferase
LIVPLPNAKEVSVKIGDRHCRIKSDDNYLDHIRGTFEPHMIELFRNLADSSQVILDIGANIGCTAILFGDMAQQVHAFEPSPTTYAYLRQNLQSNGTGNVTMHNVGLGAEEATTTITFAPNNRSGGFVSDLTKADANHVSEQIEIRTMDDVVAKLALRALDFIKIDVEGFEGNVLRGAGATLDRYRPVVVLELNHWCLNAFQRTSVPDFFDQLRAIFPIILAVDGDTYLDLHSTDESYAVMYHHIMALRYQNVVCAYDEIQLARFRLRYRHQQARPRGVLPMRIARRAVSVVRRIFR